MAVLRIEWQSMPKVAIHAPVITGKTEDPSAAEPMAPVINKPVIIYVEEMAPSIPQAKGYDPINEVVLTENKIVIASKAFTCVRTTPEKAAKDPFLMAVLGQDVTDAAASPSMLFVSPDMKVKKLLGDDVTVSNVWEEMKSLFKKTYKGDLEKIQKSMLKVLDELDTINDAKTLLKAKREKAEKPSAADRKEWEKEEFELKMRESAAISTRDGLLKFERR